MAEEKKQIGRILGSRLLVDGYAGDDGQTFTITIELVDAETGTVLWAARRQTESRQATPGRSSVIDSIARALHSKAREAQRLQAHASKVSSAYTLTLRGTMFAAQLGADSVNESRPAAAAGGRLRRARGDAALGMIAQPRRRRCTAEGPHFMRPLLPLMTRVRVP